jgi:hypothetical protein
VIRGQLPGFGRFEKTEVEGGLAFEKVYNVGRRPLGLTADKTKPRGPLETVVGPDKAVPVFIGPRFFAFDKPGMLL